MSKRRGFHMQLFRDGSLTLPEGEEERKQAARSLFGSAMVECADVWIEQAGRVLRGSPEFADLSDEQREAIQALVAYALYGSLYSQCVSIDQFTGAAIEVRLLEQDEKGTRLRETLIAGPAEDELHHAYFDWTDDFADHYDPHAGSRFSVPR